MDIALYLHAMTGLLVIIDPIGSALIFNSLTASSDQKHRNLMAVKSVIISGITLILFGNYGEALFSQLQELKFANTGKNSDISVFPMSIPLLAGPGTLTLAILLFSQNTEGHGSILSVSAAIVSVLTITLFAMVASKYLKKMIGKTGDEILRRFLGVILAALAIQFIYEGIRNIII